MVVYRAENDPTSRCGPLPYPKKSCFLSQRRVKSPGKAQSSSQAGSISGAAMTPERGAGGQFNAMHTLSTDKGLSSSPTWGSWGEPKRSENGEKSKSSDVQSDLASFLCRMEAIMSTLSLHNSQS